jgi:hypothetical protein
VQRQAFWACARLVKIRIFYAQNGTRSTGVNLRKCLIRNGVGGVRLMTSWVKFGSFSGLIVDGQCHYYAMVDYYKKYKDKQ